MALNLGRLDEYYYELFGVIFKNDDNIYESNVLKRKQWVNFQKDTYRKINP